MFVLSDYNKSIVSFLHHLDKERILPIDMFRSFFRIIRLRNIAEYSIIKLIMCNVHELYLQIRIKTINDDNI